MFLGRTSLSNNRLPVSKYGQNLLRYDPKILKFNNSPRRRFFTDDEKKRKEEEINKLNERPIEELSKEELKKKLDYYAQPEVQAEAKKQYKRPEELEEQIKKWQEEFKLRNEEFLAKEKIEEKIIKTPPKPVEQPPLTPKEDRIVKPENEKPKTLEEQGEQPIDQVPEEEENPDGPKLTKEQRELLDSEEEPREFFYDYYLTCNPKAKPEEMGEYFKKFYYDLHDATILDETPVERSESENEKDKDGNQDESEKEKERARERERQKELERQKEIQRQKEMNKKRIDQILIGPNKIPDPYYSQRAEDGKIYKDGVEVKIDENTAMPIPAHINDINDMINENEHTAGYKKKKLKLTSVKHEQNLRRLRKFRNLALLKMGMYGDISFKRENLPAFVEELKKVWDYANHPKPDQVRSGMAIIKDALDIKVAYKTGDPLRLWLAHKKFFKEHPDKTYLSLACVFLILLFAALGLAIYDQFVNDHSEEKEKEKPYFRARLVSSASYVAAGFAATLLFTRHGLNLLSNFNRLRVLFMGCATIVPFAGFLSVAESNWPRDTGLGKFYVAMAYSFCAGMGIASHTLRRGPGLLRLLVPLALTGTAFATSLALSPYSFNLEFGTPLAVYSAALAGHLFSLAVFPPYKNYARASLSAIIPFVFASVLLTQQQPYLNNIKFNPDYYGVSAYNDVAVSALYSTFFVPLKLFDGGYKYYHDRRRFYEEFHFQLPLGYEEGRQLSIPNH